MRNKIAEILKAENDQKSYLNELKEIVAIDAAAGQARTRGPDTWRGRPLWCFRADL
jgi:hypothetical protein